MKSLIILEMANNHSGCVSHGQAIIRAYAEICDRHKHDYNFVFKFQYRDLDTFIRKDMVGNREIPLIKRFSETRLSSSAFELLLNECRHQGFKTMVTPFDEASIEQLLAHDVDYIKVASCSFGDWPLLEAMAKAGKPIVASCAGASEEVIDNVVAFFKNRNIFLILQHCIGNYPTSAEDMHVGQVIYLRSRYPFLQIGFSSHEEPGTTDTAPLALALGASSFEKHVALETESIKKNKYSTSPSEFSAWLEQLSRAASILGMSSERYVPKIAETKSLRNLQRGVFVKRQIQPGERISLDDLYFAFPPTEGQMTANDISKYAFVTAVQQLAPDQPLQADTVQITNHRDAIQGIARKIVQIVKESGVTFPEFADLEISHHYGLERFYEYGLTMITVVNREYCKKILILLSGQAHPEQYHRKKEETFHVLWGSGKIRLNGKEENMKPGDVFVIQPGTLHYFSSENGLVLEEISSTHYVDDSFYTDEAIHDNKNRKTFITHWRMA
ncbi:N-acetylneuraminate synthase family protein [Synechococcus lacustris C3-12m-Tous]|uniref:N-acetylneuraminate synthase family protein n=1 Tax=Synechococcus lacustris TaxID=2116544 RepID=UPI0020CF2132|nr:N-acetylneuraminate synthase family protein [Synechococcus lacustris]MCP9925979.1 N-acetylneuraminate synthase family protein [Synechococcus lacustris C3-12m-Tous]